MEKNYFFIENKINIKNNNDKILLKNINLKIDNKFIYLNNEIFINFNEIIFSAINKSKKYVMINTKNKIININENIILIYFDDEYKCLNCFKFINNCLDLNSINNENEEEEEENINNFDFLDKIEIKNEIENYNDNNLNYNNNKKKNYDLNDYIEYNTKNTIDYL